MRIGIDISQIVYEGTGVARYVEEMVYHLIERDIKQSYVLFGSSLRKRNKFLQFYNLVKKVHKNVNLIVLPFPPIVLSLLWNKLHIMPVEWFTGRLDFFWSSDWTQPPLLYAKGMTTIHDMMVYRFAQESYDQTHIDIQNLTIKANIVKTQKSRLFWVKKECRIILCDSQATKDDVIEFLHVDPSQLHVVYPGYL